jgi:hypothetical protein
VKLHEHYHNGYLPPACLSYAHQRTCQFWSSNMILSIFVYTPL